MGPVAPQFTCPNKNDSFTKNDTEKGNGKLSEKVGLITVDEAIAAGTGGYNSGTNKNNYLHKNTGYWTSSPTAYYSGSSSANMFVINSSNLSYNEVKINNMFAIVPVISLTPEYFYNLTGDGTINNSFRENGMEP